MLRRFLVALVLLGAGVSFAAPGDPDYVPMSCAATHMDVLVGWVNAEEQRGDGDADGNPWTYVCAVGGVDYLMKIEHVTAAVLALGDPWSDYVLGEVDHAQVEVYRSESSPGAKTPVKMFTLEVMGPAYSQAAGAWFYYYKGRNVDATAGWFEIRIPGQAADDYAARAQYLNELALAGVLELGSALRLLPDFVPLDAFQTQVETVFFGGQTLAGNYPPGYEGPGGGPGGEGGGGDPNDPYKPGDREGRCGQGEGLSWFEAGISKMFQPCEDWPARWAGLAAERDLRIPFGYLSWVPWFGGDASQAGRNGDQLMIGCLRVSANASSGPSCTEYIEVAGQTLEPVRVSEIELFVWWHETGRTWLYYLLLLGMVFGFIRLVVEG